MDYDEPTDAKSRSAATGIPAETDSARSIDSADLLAGAREIVIRHGESRYRLRSTNSGKLILTK